METKSNPKVVERPPLEPVGKPEPQAAIERKESLVPKKPDLLKLSSTLDIYSITKILKKVKQQQ